MMLTTEMSSQVHKSGLVLLSWISGLFSTMSKTGVDSHGSQTLALRWIIYLSLTFNLGLNMLE